MPLQVVRYRCEICNSEFNNESDAVKCESDGLPEPLEWLKPDENGRYMILDGDGARLAEPYPEDWFPTEKGTERFSLAIESAMPPGLHIWKVWLVPGKEAPLSVFDPRLGVGVGSFVYKGAFSTGAAGFDIWLAAMKRHGFTSADIDEDNRDSVFWKPVIKRLEALERAEQENGQW